MPVLVIAPAFNEAQNIVRVVEAARAQALVDAVLVVDDCSTDATSEVARAAGALVVRHAQNQGAGAAIRTGIHYAIEQGYDVVAVVAGDDQHDMTELPRVLQPVLDGQVDLCQGSRFAKGGRVEGRNAFRTPLIRLYSFIFTVLTRTRLSDATNGLRAFRPATLLALDGVDLNQAWLERYELEPYILYQGAVHGLRIREVPCTVRYPRGRRTTHMRPLLDWWRLFRPMVFLWTGYRR